MDDNEFVDLDINQPVNNINNNNNTHPPIKTENFNSNATSTSGSASSLHHGNISTAFTPDDLLDELSLEDNYDINYLSRSDNRKSMNGLSHIDTTVTSAKQSYYTSPPSSSTIMDNTSHYDQFFEEVSLDLPRDETSQYNNNDAINSNKLFNFIPRRNTLKTNNNSNSSNNSRNNNHHRQKENNNDIIIGKSTIEKKDQELKITPSDISGPFYSISDVLSDVSMDNNNNSGSGSGSTTNNGSLANMNTATLSTSSSSPIQQIRGAKRNVFEQEVVVQSGGSNFQGVQRRRSSLNPFRSLQKPSPLESVVSKTRPRMLPPKDPKEEKKHLQQHEKMIKKALQIEAKKQKQHDRKKEQNNKKMTQAINHWEQNILPQWNKKRMEKKTQDLWLQGIPPRCRRKVWILAIGNKLNLTKETLSTCLRRLPSTSTPSTIATKKQNRSRYNFSQHELLNKENNNSDLKNKDSEYNDGSGDNNDHDHQDTPFYRIRRDRRTSSLNVLNEDINKDSTLDDDDDDKDRYSDSNESNSHSDDSNGSALSVNNVNNYEDLVNRNHDMDTQNDDNVLVLDDDEDEDEEDTTDDEDRLQNNQDSVMDRNMVTFLKKAVDEDIIRTLPSLCVFQPDGPLFASLKRVLHAYIGYRSDMQYPHGTSFLAGMLLLNMGQHDTFISLINLIHTSPLLSSLYSSDEPKMKGYFKIFNVIFAEHMPKLYLHFKNLSLTPDNYLPDWFMTLYSSMMPLSMSCRLWDIFLLEGDRILFKTGLVVLKYLEPLLWGGGFSETVRILNMGFIGEHRGEEAKAALAVSGITSKGDFGSFFNDILDDHMVHLDTVKYSKLMNKHIPK
ncbi:unnamed protein product [Cunninghamella echinulata]